MLALYTLVVVLLLFGVTIFVHELGHFLVARWCGMVVDVFSIGFGPALWKKKVGDVTYKIGVFPFGGYVALPQFDPTERKQAEGEPERTLPPIAPWKKILVALAGVVGNLLLAVFLAYVVYWVGKPSSASERSCVLGFVQTNSAAYAEGLRAGDRVVAIDGDAVENWDQLSIRMALLQQATLEVSGPAGMRALEFPLSRNELGIWSLPGVSPINFCDVGSVFPGSSAAEAGIEPGDRILRFDGQDLYSREQLIHLVGVAVGKTVPVVVLRGDREVTLEVTPAFNEEAQRALIGVGFTMLDIDYDTIVHPTPMSQLRGHATAILRFLKALVTPKQARAAAQGVGGPIAIIVVFWWAVQKSLMIAIWFACFVNVNLAIINLLPLPILDGGHIVFSLWEWIFGKPIHPRVINVMMNLFFVLILAVFLFLSYRDIVNLILPNVFRSDRSAPVEQTTPSNAAPSAVDVSK